MQNKPVLIATNPLHYTYFRRKHTIETIGSTRGLLEDYAEELGFDTALTLFDVPNAIEPLLSAHQATQTEKADYIAWKRINVAADFFGNSFEPTRDLERKANIRSLLPGSLFPEFEIIERPNVAEISYEVLRKNLASDGLVVQIDFSTGGKGTFFVSNSAELSAIRQILVESDQDIVVSREIAGKSYGLQCMILDGKVFSPGWWHQDLVGIEGIYHDTVASATKYCGAVLENIPEVYKKQVQELINQVGQRLIGLDYKGIFGMDIVIDTAAEKVYLIEINPRFTAVSHVYATAMRAVGYDSDYLTMHVEDLLGMAPGNSGNKMFEEPRDLPADYYYLKIQNLSKKPAKLSTSCRLGVYSQDSSYLRFGFGIDSLENDNEIVVIPESSKEMLRVPGERIFSIIGFGNPVIDKHLDPAFAQFLEKLRHQFIVEV